MPFAKGFATFLHLAQDLQRGLQPSCNLRGTCKGVCNLPATCAGLAKGSATFLQFAQSLQSGLQPSCNLRGACKGVCSLPATCAELATAIAKVGTFLIYANFRDEFFPPLPFLLDFQEKKYGWGEKSGGLCFGLAHLWPIFVGRLVKRYILWRTICLILGCY